MPIVINEEIIQVTLEAQVIQVTVDTSPILPVVVGIQGPQGAMVTTVKKTAGEILSGHRVVIIGDDSKVYYADRTIDAHKHKVLGLTTGAIIQDDEATIHVYGSITEPSWNWTMGQPVFLGTNGQLTQTPPTSGFILQIGFPLSAISLFVDIDKPITLV